jgi:hypothetical protein
MQYIHVFRNGTRRRVNVTPGFGKLVNFEMGKEFRYFGTTLINQNSVQEEIKSKLKSGNACYHSVQNLLSSSLLSKF